MRSNARASIGFDMSDTTLGTELRRLRGGRSLRDITKATGINYGTLSRIENDRIDLPTRETLAALSEVYQVPLSTLAQLAYCAGRSVTYTPPNRETALAAT